MPQDKDDAIEIARRDLAQRLKISESALATVSVEPVDFPDAALGAPLEDEMSAQMIMPGWRIILKAGETNYEYRASARQLRLFHFNGANYRV